MDQAAALAGEGLASRLLHVFLFLGSEWVLYLLLVLSVISLGIALERVLHFWRRREDLIGLRHALDAHLASNEVGEARARLSASPSHVAAVVLRGLDAMPRGAPAVEEIVASATQLERLQMERGLAFLGTLGNNAPFIGLFGTVLGIIRAFRDLSLNTSAGSAAVMAGIAEALIATAVGLLVALPAVAIFNSFQRTIRAQLAAADAMARLVLAYIKTPRE